VSLPVPNDQYQLGWIRGQADLVAALLDSRLTMDEAVQNLSGKRRVPKHWWYGRGWHDGQVDLVNALYERRITLRAAALNLGVRAPDELPGEDAGGGRRSLQL
jgi:hypothetical protein